MCFTFDDAEGHIIMIVVVGAGSHIVSQDYGPIIYGNNW